MKKISDLGLTFLETRDGGYLVKGTSFTKLSAIKEADIPEGWAFGIDDLIASTVQTGTFPLLVIEDEAERWFDDFWMSKYSPYNSDHGKAFKGGFDKARETYKFTEDDLRKAMDFAYDFLDHYIPESVIYDRYGIENSDSMNTYQAHDAFIQSLIKKELWVETNDYCKNPYTTDSCPCQNCKGEVLLKITNNQIKAVWK